ncbi:hypothetical protein ACS0TY_010412 [Phlomoides rotata]
MDGKGIVGGDDSEKGKAPRGCRSWTRVEEDALIQCLLGIVNDGWKVDNGFKASFQRELEKGMRKLLPGTDILATPHINSKIHVWKKKYGTLSDLLSKSGIGWNSISNTLDIIGETVWDAQRKVDSGVKSLRYKSFPYYDSWLDIFGKDRATGEYAADPIDLANDILKSSNERGGESDGKTRDTKNDEVDENTLVCKPTDTGANNKPSEAGATTSKVKKRKSVDPELKSFVDSIGHYMKNSDDTFNNLAKRMGTEYDAKVARTTLNDVMKLIPGISLQDKFKVSDLLIQNTNRHEYFLSLPEEEQSEYVWMLLDGKL